MYVPDREMQGFPKAFEKLYPRRAGSIAWSQHWPSEGRATFIGSVKWAPPDGRDSVLFSVISGSGRFNQARNFHNPEIFDLVYTHKCNAQLNYNFESLYGFTTNVPDIGFANWFGVLNYLTCQFGPRWSGTTRLEFFDDF